MGIAYNTNIVKEGLVLHLDAANVKSYPGSGTAWNDLSGNGNNATLINAPTFSSGTFIFNGTNQYATIPDSSTLSFVSNSFAFDYWVYFNNLTSNNGIVGKGQGQWEYAIYAASTTSQQFYAWPTSGASGVYTPISTTFNAATWYHHCWTANGTTNSLYVNGVIKSTSNKTAYNMGDGGNIVTIAAGGNAGGLRYLNGNLSNFKIYNRELSATEISQNFEAMRGRYGI